MSKRKKKKKNRGFRFFVKVQIILILLVLAGLAFYFFGGYAKKIGDLKSEAYDYVRSSSEETFRSSETSLVYDSNGDLISVLKGEKDVYYLEYEDIPTDVCSAIITIEDKKFYQHHGVDFKGILRAVKAMIENGKVTQGASTITQQLARNIFLTQEKTWERKVEEMFIATEMERVYTKEQILEYYLNNIYFGNGYYGIQAASKGYFNTEVKNLDLSQIAFLCAIPNNPTLYDPVTNPQNTIKRRDRILNQMEEDGKISETVCEEAKAEAMMLERPQNIKNDYVETYTYYCATRALMAKEGFRFKYDFKSAAEKESYQMQYESLYEICNKKLYTEGYRIYTSVDLSMQQELQNSIDIALQEYTEVNEEGIYTLQSAAVCMDNQSGYVKAIVGGRSQDYNGYTINRAYKSFRQPGSSIKPLLVYTPALENDYTPDSEVVDAPIEDGPSNSDGSYAGSMTLRRAVELSKNTVAWNLLEEMSPEKGLSYLEKMNFSRLDENDKRPAAALGGFTNGISPLEMAAGYATIENDGLYREPTCILKITDSDGETILSTKQEETAVYRENAARTMTDILKGVLTNGTGRGLSLSGMPCAGKTGTTNDNKDGWFVGYTRYYTTSVWVGYDMPRTLDGLSGATYPGNIWKNFMEKVHVGLPAQEFLTYASKKKEPEEPVEPEPLEQGDQPDENVPEDSQPETTEEQPPVPEDNTQVPQVPQEDGEQQPPVPEDVGQPEVPAQEDETEIPEGEEPQTE
ncbi:MAG: PBP1A family penicillin-binding protein [Lachnospiraceae bacterium]|nr:PBP1A family penicillin-binding protein [Lachnospiraceae bacterium]